MVCPSTQVKNLEAILDFSHLLLRISSNILLTTGSTFKCTTNQLSSLHLLCFHPHHHLSLSPPQKKKKNLLLTSYFYSWNFAIHSLPRSQGDAINVNKHLQNLSHKEATESLCSQSLNWAGPLQVYSCGWGLEQQPCTPVPSYSLRAAAHGLFMWCW